jgi:hypothetical protein
VDSGLLYLSTDVLRRHSKPLLGRPN